MDSLKLRGMWWEPSDPAQKWFGFAKWKAEQSPKVSIIARTSERALRPPNEAEALWLESEDATPYTALRWGYSSIIEKGLFSEHSGSAGHLLRGIHVESKDAFKTNKVTCYLQYLNSWFNGTGFESERREGTHISYQRPDDIEFAITPKLNMSIGHKFKSFHDYRKHTLEEDVFLSFSKSSGFGFKHAIEWVNAMRLLLHFSTLKRVYATNVSFGKYQDIRLYNGGIHDEEPRKLHEVNLVFTYGSIQERFSAFIRDWLEFCLSYRESLGSYTTTVYIDLPPEVENICLTQALESYDQRRFKPKVGDDQHLVNRIRRLCNLNHEKIAEIISDIDKFSKVTRDTRHYYTHHSQKILSDGNVARGKSLVLLNSKLEYLFRVCVLEQFGLCRDSHNVLRRMMPSRVIEY